MIAVGIDVSKSKSTVAIVNSDGEVLLPPRNVFHTENDLRKLVSLISSFPDNVKIAMEATGHYHYTILKMLIDNNFYVTVLNPYLKKI